MKCSCNLQYSTLLTIPLTYTYIGLCAALRDNHATSFWFGIQQERDCGKEWIEMFDLLLSVIVDALYEYTVQGNQDSIVELDSFTKSMTFSRCMEFYLLTSCCCCCCGCDRGFIFI